MYSAQIWTRKGSLQASLLDAICDLPKLERLEINATPAGEWRAEQLLRLPITLKTLTLLLPEREIISYTLPEWLKSLARHSSDSTGLSTLSLVCFQSTVVNPTNFRDIAVYLPRLTSLTLHGCSKLSDDDILFAIKHCGKISHLSLETVGISADFYTLASPYLPHLTSLRTSHPGRKSLRQQAYYDGLTTLVQACPNFQSFTHYLSGDSERGMHPQVPTLFIERLIECCGTRLRKFEINGLSLSQSAIKSVCFGTSCLEDLVIPVSAEDIVSMNSLSKICFP
jgi:hypothetical protein